MSSAPSSLAHKWWFVLPGAFISAFATSFLFRSAGINTSNADFWSALSAIHILTVVGLCVLTSLLLEFVALRLWPGVSALIAPHRLATFTKYWPTGIATWIGAGIGLISALGIYMATGSWVFFLVMPIATAWGWHRLSKPTTVASQATGRSNE